MKWRKTEREALVAACKVKAAQRLYYEELRQRKLIAEVLAEKKKELEVTRSLLEKFSQELHEALDQKLLLEVQLENFQTLREGDGRENIVCSLTYCRSSKITVIKWK